MYVGLRQVNRSLTSEKPIVGLGPMEDTMQSMPPLTGCVTADSQIQYLMELNAQHSSTFSSPAEKRRRLDYRVKHPTEIAAWKCMDGREDLSVATNTPLGIIQPSRNIGGRFDLGWPYFGKDVSNWVDYALSQNRNCIILVTYHFSRGDHHRGCAGFGYDTDAAITEAKIRVEQIRRVFRTHRCTVYPILLGFETDLDACILHGTNGAVFDLSDWDDTYEDVLINVLAKMFPDMQPAMLNDLLPLVVGNINHISEIKGSNREIIDTDHREWVIGVGRGFDWLRKPNLALIVGQYSPNLGSPIATAASIIKTSMEAGRIDNKSFVLLSSALYREPRGIEPDLAIEKALFLQNFAADVITKAHPELAKRMQRMAVIVDMNTRRMEIVE